MRTPREQAARERRQAITEFAQDLPLVLYRARQLGLHRAAAAIDRAVKIVDSRRRKHA